MAIQGIGASGITPIQFPDLNSTKQAGETGGAQGGSFSNAIGDALQNLQSTQTKSDDLAMQMATGQLTDVHDYMIAANQAEIATQLTVAVRNKAVDAFNQIMNMQV